METLIGLDPSFTRTGICIIDLNSKYIWFETAGCKIGEKQFENVVHAAKSIVNQLSIIFAKHDENYDLIHENPIPNSTMSAALYALDTLIYSTFEQHIKKTYNPATLRSKIHGRKYDKKDSIELANKYLKILNNSGYIIKSEMGTKKKIVHDCAEAFLYCHLYLHELNHKDFNFDNSEDIKIYKDKVKAFKKKEKELLSSKSDIVI